jgi:hypothetical protein
MSTFALIDSVILCAVIPKLTGTLSHITGNAFRKINATMTLGCKTGATTTYWTKFTNTHTNTSYFVWI